jgi:hypothetical protein
MLSQINSDRETIATSRQLLARYRRIEAELPIIRAQLDELKDNTDGNRYFFASASPALAAAEMQNAVRGLVSSSGTTLRSSKSIQPIVENGFDRVGIDLDVTASTPQIAALLRAIAGAEPVVLVERMLAQVPETGAASAAADAQPAVTVSLRLVSYAKHAQIGAKS